MPTLPPSKRRPWQPEPQKRVYVQHAARSAEYGSSLFTYARVLVEFWRDNPADPTERPRSQELIAVYDPSATPDHFGYATSGGPAAGVSKLGLKLVFPNDPAVTGVLAYDPAQPVTQGQPCYYDDGQGVKFYEALQALAAPVPAPVRGQTTSYWRPIADPPVPGGGPPVYTDAQARAAQLNRVASTNMMTITLTAEAPTDYGTAYTGTFTVDASTAVPGKVVLFRVGPGGGAPAFINASQAQPYNLSAGAFVPGKTNSYSVAVLADEIEVINLPR